MPGLFVEMGTLQFFAQICLAQTAILISASRLSGITDVLHHSRLNMFHFLKDNIGMESFRGQNVLLSQTKVTCSL
jgi:hypothetical protein